MICGAVTITLLLLCGGGLAAARTMLGPTQVFGFAVWAMVVAMCHTLGLLVFGLPLLWLWPRAFQRHWWRGVTAATLGATIPVAAGFAIGGEYRVFSEPLFVASAALAGFVWWSLNLDVAPDGKSAPGTANDLH